MRLDGSTACMAVEGATDTELFRAYVRRVLCPTLRTGDVVIMDNLSPHKSAETLGLIQKLGAHVLFLPAYSPDAPTVEALDRGGVCSIAGIHLMRTNLRRACDSVRSSRTR